MTLRSRLVVLALVAASPAVADEAYDRCMNASDATNTAWEHCGGEWVAREDVKLTTTWKSLSAVVAGKSKSDLVAEQRAWIAYKDIACNVYADGESGREGHVLQFPVCRAGVLAQRTKDLEQYLAYFDERK